MDTRKVMHTVFGILGNAFGLFLFLSPSVTFKRIIIGRSTEDFSGIPYVAALVNCLISTWYGMPFITTGNILVLVINVIGAVIESIYVVIFLIFARKREKVKIVSLLATTAAVISGIAAVSLLSPVNRQLFCGGASVISGCIMFAAPLSVMRQVINSKSVEYMPFYLSLFAFLCAACWFIYGLLAMDIFLWVPNGIGCLLGAIQLVLYACYRGETTTISSNGSVEIGQTSYLNTLKLPHEQ